jgi:MOSC domain-containing protein
MLLGTLAAIWRYPVKSLRAEALERASVTVSGIPGDRATALFVLRGHPREGKTFRGKEHDRLHLAAGAGAAVELGALRGVELEPRTGEHFFDDAPVSLLIDRWLDSLNAHVGYPVEPERFRPNFLVRAGDGFGASEAELEGAEILLGAVRLRVRGAIGRCVTTTYDPRGGTADPEILRYVAQARASQMGVYCDVLEPGIVRRGDPLVRIPAG